MSRDEHLELCMASRACQALELGGGVALQVPRPPALLLLLPPTEKSRRPGIASLGALQRWWNIYLKQEQLVVCCGCVVPCCAALKRFCAQQRWCTEVQARPQAPAPAR